MTTDIRSALEGRLKDFAATKSLKVVWENVSTSSTITTPHFISRLIRGTTQDPSLGANHQRHTGVYRITYRIPGGINKGTGAMEAMLEELIAYFPRGLQLTHDGVITRITSTPSMSPDIGYEGNDIFNSVTISYRTEILT